MRYYVLLLCITALCFVLVPRGSSGDPQCTVEWCKLDGGEPGCSAENQIRVGWAINFPSSPSSASAGSCSGYTLDNVYDDVEFFALGCEDEVADHTCDNVFSSSSGLAGGKYVVDQVDGLCFRICELCN